MSDKKTQFAALLAKGMNAADAARAIDIPESTGRRWRLKMGTASKSAPTEAVEAMRQASPQYRDRVPVVQDYTEDDAEPMDVVWDRVEANNAKLIEKHRKLKYLTLDLSHETLPILLVFSSDQHIGRGYTDLARLRHDAQLFGETDGLYVCLAGDGVDNHIKHRAAMVNASDDPASQYRLYEYWLSIFAHRVTCVITGNHEYWGKQFSGVDAVATICKHNRYAYCLHEARLQVKMRSRTVKVRVRHTYPFNSRFNQTHSPKQWARMGGEAMADIYCLGDKHEFALETCEMHGQKRHFCRPGAYQISSGFSDQYGYNDATPTCPSVMLFPNGSTLAFDDLNEAVAILRAKRGGK
mgnify:CR=1 FL=1